jgi:hypothetical protein
MLEAPCRSSRSSISASPHQRPAHDAATASPRNVSRLALVGLAFTLGAAGACASVSPPQRHVSRKVLKAESVVGARHEGDAFVAESKWESDRFSATVKRHLLCEHDVEETVETTTSTTYTTKNLATDIGGGAATVAIGGLALLGAPTLPDATEDPSSQGTSPRTSAQIFGWSFLVVGGVFLAHGLVTSANAMDEVSDPVLSNQRRKAAGRRRPCGTGPAGEGLLVGRIGERLTRLGDLPPTGEITILPRTMGDKLCASVDDLSATAEFLFISRGKEDARESELRLTQYKLEGCVRATLAQQRLDEADSQLKGPSSRQISTGIRVLRSAAILTRGLKEDDPDRERLLRAIEERQPFAEQRAQGAIELETKRALGAIEKDPQAAISAVADVSGLAMAMADGKNAWTTIYAAFARRVQARGIDGYAIIEQLLKVDEAAFRCSSPGPTCPPWVTQEILPETIRPALASAASAVGRLVHEATDVSNELRRDISIKSIERFTALRLNAEKLLITCSGVRATFVPLAERCESLRHVLSAAGSIMSERADQVNEVRRKQVEAEDRERLRKALATWRAHFSACKRLRDGVTQLERVRDEGRCGADCQNVIRRMQAEDARLQEFHADLPFEDPAIRDRLRGECEAAGCTVCP